MATRLFIPPPVWAEDAVTPFPVTPTPGIAYRNDAVLPSVIEEGQRFFDDLLGENWNDQLFKIGEFIKEVSQTGVTAWSPLVNYPVGALQIGSDNGIYQAILASGSSGEGAKDPVSEPTFWVDIEGIGTIPIGGGIWFFGASIPSNFLKLDFSPISRTTYALLFAVIGTLYGPGDGATTFNLPDGLGHFLRVLNETGSGFDPSRVLGTFQNFSTARPQNTGVGGRMDENGNIVAFATHETPIATDPSLSGFSRISKTGEHVTVVHIDILRSGVEPDMVNAMPGDPESRGLNLGVNFALRAL